MKWFARKEIKRLKERIDQQSIEIERLRTLLHKLLTDDILGR